MKILALGNFWLGWDGSVCDERNISLALQGLGHEVIEVQREELKIPSGDYDIGLIAQWRDWPEDIITQMRGAGCKTVIYWAFDYQWDSHEEWHFRLAREADIFLSKEMANRQKYEGANFHWLPQDFAPDFLTPHPEPIAQDIDVLFTGSYLPQAKERSEALLAVDKRFNLEVRGITYKEWEAVGIKHSYGPMLDQKFPLMCARAKINLSVDNVFSEGYWSDRNAQAMACGGFVLFKYTPMSEVVFGQNIAYFHDIPEMLEKIEYYLTHDNERLEIAERGYQFARANLMCTNRVREMLEIWRDYEVR